MATTVPNLKVHAAETVVERLLDVLNAVEMLQAMMMDGKRSSEMNWHSREWGIYHNLVNEVAPAVRYAKELRDHLASQS